MNGDLGHQSWSPQGDWSTDTLPASIARSSIPRVIPRTDGSRIVDAYYREVDGDLGHQWWTPGTGHAYAAITYGLGSLVGAVLA